MAASAKLAGILSTTWLSSGGHRRDMGEIGLAHRVEPLGREGSDAGGKTRSSPSACNRLSSPAPCTIACEARICSTSVVPERGMPTTKMGRSGARAHVRFRCQQSRRENLGDLGHPAIVLVGVVSEGRALEPVALVIVAEGLGRVAEVEIGLAEAEMQRRAFGGRDALALKQRLHLGDQRVAGLEALEVSLAEQDPGACGKALAASSSASRPRPCGRTP